MAGYSDDSSSGGEEEGRSLGGKKLKVGRVVGKLRKKMKYRKGWSDCIL